MGIEPISSAWKADILSAELTPLTSLHTLSKTQAFNSLYSTPKAKVDVMLFNWGFADPLKIRSVQDRL